MGAHPYWYTVPYQSDLNKAFTRSAIHLFGVAVLAYLISDIWFGALAHVNANAVSMTLAVRTSIHDSLERPVGSALLFAPFAAMAYLSAVTLKRKSISATCLQFVLGMLTLAGIAVINRSSFRAPSDIRFGSIRSKNLAGELGWHFLLGAGAYATIRGNEARR